jgi:[protein-PII] uridylyltransferase
MVRLHLLLPDAATRRDLDDPVTVQKVAEAVGDPLTLTLLGALAEADGLATGTSAWGPWKAGLVAELVKRTAAYLGGQPLSKASGWVTDGHHRLMEEVRDSGQPSVVLDPPRVTVVAADRPGLLASVAGILALHGLDVRSADATSGDGVAVEVFTVEVPRGSWPDSARLREDLDAVLGNRLQLDARLAARAVAYAGESRQWSARTIIPQVLTDNEASASSTVLELRAPDEVGLLHRITQALFDCTLNVVSARVSTIGPEVVDAFYVRTEAGEKVTDPAQLRSIEEAVRAAAG